MITGVANQLAILGIAAVLPDLYGTGDSDGNFGDASVEQWLRDLDVTGSWATARGWEVDSIVGIRLGCLIAAQYCRQRQLSLKRAVFWQPVLEGARALDQFLRIRTAAAAMADKQETTAELRLKLNAGECINVAGYEIAPQLAEQLDTLRLTEIVTRGLGVLHWFEVVRSADSTITTPVLNAAKKLGEAGSPPLLRSFVGEPFWASTEIVGVATLVEATATAIADADNA
jgi:exosortase A-associated hydrolase 2